MVCFIPTGLGIGMLSFKKDHAKKKIDSYRQNKQTMPLDISVLNRFRNGYRVFVETGTYHGDGVRAALAAGFEEVHSIELAPHHFENARKTFATDPRVHIWHGDSSKVLNSVIKTISEPIVFWLDGHYSCGDTARGNKWCPLMEELQVIQKRAKPDTILIDDMRCWTRDNPEYGFGKEDIEAAIRSINPSYSIQYVTGDPRFINDVLVAQILQPLPHASLLFQCARNVYSQFGEDGIIQKIFEMIGVKTTGSGLCVEFGAADGFWFSNTANLWSSKTNGANWKAVLIESNPQHTPALTRLTANYKNCLAIHRTVTPENLAALLREHHVVLSDVIDLLSIDVDGDDIYIFESLKRQGIEARVVIVEHNPTFPYWVDIAQKPGQRAGSSVQALNRVGRMNDYVLVCVTDSNCIFVRKSEAMKITQYYDTDMDKLCGPVLQKYLTCIGSTYNGLQKTIGTCFPYGNSGVMPNDVISIRSPPSQSIE